MITASSAFLAANASRAKQPIHALQIAGYSRVFTTVPTGVSGHVAWVEDIQDTGKTVNELDGSMDLGEVDVTVQDRSNLITADFPSFTFEGKKATLLSGFAGMNFSDYITLHTGIIDAVNSSNKNLSYTFTILDKTASLQKTIYTTGDSGAPIDSKNPKTINGHPLDILVDILENQVGYSSGDIDITKIQAYRDGIFSGIQFKFVLTSSPTAADFIANQIMKPLGGYYWNNNLDQFTVNFFYPLAAPSSVLSLSKANILDIPEASQIDLINNILFRFDKDDTGATATGNFLNEAVQNYTSSITKYGLYASHIIESDGMRAGLQGYLVAAQIAQMLFYRYGSKNLCFGRGSSGTPVDAYWSAAVLEPGDVIDLTHSAIPDRVAGTMGITSKLFEVLDVKRDYAAATVQLSLLDASYLSKFGTYLWTPDGEAHYTLASSADKAKYMFMCNDSDQYSNGDAAHILG